MIEITNLEEITNFLLFIYLRSDVYKYVDTQIVIMCKWIYVRLWVSEVEKVSVHISSVNTR